ncbi:hypothetical protein PoB_006843600 [Plakobranchus ocellatus]|uniref:Uncharacterized protein n=1 Tax=Plakobranchus ocellatus TaxID=259542 RepID=A0AAV4DCY6_9GAST|nr:hypothetical protein PoB_006843600 [Plakobranchus ocellatus]
MDSVGPDQTRQLPAQLLTIVGFSRSQPAYYTWCVTRHNINRAQYVSATYQMANIESKKCETHKESSLSKRKLGEKAVKKIMDTFSAFLNLFNTERKHLACISSGQKVPQDIADDLLKVEDVGKKSFKEFVATRLKDKTTRFHKPLTKTKLKTVGSVSKSTQIKSAKNVVKNKSREKYIWATPCPVTRISNRHGEIVEIPNEPCSVVIVFARRPVS